MRITICREGSNGGSFSKANMDIVSELISNWFGGLKPIIQNHRSVKIEEILITPEIVDVFNMGMRVAIRISTPFGEINFSQYFIGVIVNKKRNLKQFENWKFKI